MFEIDENREAAIGHKGKGMRGIERCRGEDGQDMAFETLLRPFFFAFGQIVMIANVDIINLHLTAQALPCCVHVLYKGGAFGADKGELFGRGETVNTGLIDAFTDLRGEAGDTHHKEFLHIAGGDGAESNALE